MTTNKEWALAYAQAGYPIFPVTRDKNPATKNGFYDATTNPKVIKRWYTDNPDYGIAIPTGPLTRIAVIDIDVKNGSKGEESLRQMQEKYGELPDVPVQQTGSGGWQFFFKYVAGVNCTTNIRGFKGIDIRGKGGYVVVPESMHPSGNTYQWLKSLLDVKQSDLPDIPSWIIEYFTTKKKSSKKKNHETVSIEELEELLGRISPERADEYQNWLEVGMGCHYATNGDQHGLLAWIDWSQQSDKFEQGVCDKLWEIFDDDKGITTATLAFYANEDSPIEKKEKGILDFPFTDVGNASLVQHVMGHKIRYNVDRDRWAIFNGYVWEYDSSGAIVRLILEVIAQYKEAVKQIQDNEKRASFYKQALSLESVNKINNLLSMLKNLDGIATREADWDSDPYLLGCKNGILDMRTGELIQNASELLISRTTNIVFDDKMDCPQWRKFIHDVFDGNKEVMRFVQKAIGYTLTGLTSEQCFFMLLGNGSNGKSVLVNTVNKLLGSYAEVSSMSTFERKTNQSTVSTNIAKLAGCRFTFAAESNQGGAGFDEALIKQIVAGDPIAARFMFENEFSFIPRLKLWFAVNHAPKFKDDSKGFERRIRLINFPVTFEGSRVDRDLPNKLSAELSGILNWALYGLRDWMDNGLEAPKEVTEATKQYLDENNPLHEFIVDTIITDETCETTLDDAYRAYQAWARTHGLMTYQLKNRPDFTSRLEKIYDKQVNDGHISFAGMRLKPVDTSSGVVSSFPSFASVVNLKR